VSGDTHSSDPTCGRDQGTGPQVDAETLARRFHETYERLAPTFGYTTRPETAVPWEQVPELNRQLMIAVCQELLRELGGVTEEPSTQAGELE
jgi:hypothetical protein